MRYARRALCFALAALSLSGCGGDSGSAASSAGIPGTIASPVTVDITACDSTHASSSPPFDLAISGSGRFKLSAGGTVTYTRSGRFHLETSNTLKACVTFPAYSGFIVDASGNRLTGYRATSASNGSSSLATETEELNLLTGGDMAQSATTTVSAKANLDSAASIKSADTFDPAVATTYNFTSSIDIYDSLGTVHALGIFYLKTAVNDWHVFVVDGDSRIDVGRLTFDSTGKIASSVPDMPADVSLPLTTGAVTPFTFRFDPTGTTVAAVTSNMPSLTQNGYASGVVSGFSIATSGTITVRYSNGQSAVMGKVAIVE